MRRIARLDPPLTFSYDRPYERLNGRRGRPLVARDDRPVVQSYPSTVVCGRCGVETGNTTTALCLNCERPRKVDCTMWAIDELKELVDRSSTAELTDDNMLILKAAWAGDDERRYAEGP